MGQHTAQPQMRGSGPAKTGPRGSDEERRALETSSFQSHSASGGDQASARREAGPSGPRSAAQQTQKRPRLAASGRQCPEAPQAECGPTELGQGVQRGASARGWRSGTGTGSGPAVAGLPARLETAGCCSLTRQPRLHGLSPRE